MKKWILVLTGCVSVMSVACNENPVTVPNTQCPSTSVEVLLPSGEIACKIERPIVIETGFECGSMLRNNRFDFESFSVCDSRPILPRADFNFLNGLDLHFRMPTLFPATPVTPSTASSLDLLWVIDNSGSMCEEQGQIIAGVRTFVEQIVESGIDLQMGITTTHTNNDYDLEPLARAGQLQSTPQPVPGYDPSCINGLDENGQVIADDFSPITNALAIAVSCVQDPVVGEFEWTVADIDCAMNHTVGCQIVRLGCTDEFCTPEMLFPEPARYRQLPKVFKSAAYKTGDTYDFVAMSEDLACMALVGTKGYGIERGFEALTLALSPALNAPGASNEGLIRPDARLGVLFVTDEDDCSGNVDLNICGQDACNFAKTNSSWGTLTPPTDVVTDLYAAAGALKGHSLDPREVLVASFHAPGVFDGEVLPITATVEECSAITPPPACATSLGVAYSGERYGEFLRALPLGNTYPFSPNRITPIEGVVCEGGLFNPLNEVADFFVTSITDAQ